jgi:hypothetical protein
VASDYPFLEKKKKVLKMNTTPKKLDLFGNSVEILKKKKKKKGGKFSFSFPLFHLFLIPHLL